MLEFPPAELKLFRSTHKSTSVKLDDKLRQAGEHIANGAIGSLELGVGEGAITKCCSEHLFGESYFAFMFLLTAETVH